MYVVTTPYSSVIVVSWTTLLSCFLQFKQNFFFLCEFRDEKRTFDFFVNNHNTKLTSICQPLIHLSQITVSKILKKENL